jgi:hypothetical protein
MGILFTATATLGTKVMALGVSQTLRRSWRQFYHYGRDATTKTEGIWMALVAGRPLARQRNLTGM